MVPPRTVQTAARESRAIFAGGCNSSTRRVERSSGVSLDLPPSDRGGLCSPHGSNRLSPWSRSVRDDNTHLVVHARELPARTPGCILLSRPGSKHRQARFSYPKTRGGVAMGCWRGDSYTWVVVDGMRVATCSERERSAHLHLSGRSGELHYMSTISVPSAPAATTPGAAKKRIVVADELG